jgi:hypothetical protein
LCRRKVRYRAQVIILAAMVIFLPFLHLDIETSDDSWLLWVDGRPVDVAGYFSEQLTRITRRCDQVEMVMPNDPLHEQALNAIRLYSPPDSLTAQLLQLTRQDEWLLAQVKFDQLQDAVVLLNQSAHEIVIATSGIWSGPTHPHHPEPLIRRFIRNGVPSVPEDLMSCFDHVFRQSHELNGHPREKSSMHFEDK